MPMTLPLKLIFLHELKLRKNIIFGSFNDVKDGKRKKAAAWEEIRVILESHGYSKDYTYIRDTEWGNMRTRAMAKRDKNRQTGSAPQMMDEADNAVLEIIGRESPAVMGLNVRESVSIPNTTAVCPAPTVSEEDLRQEGVSGLPFESVENTTAYCWPNGNISEVSGFSCRPAPRPMATANAGFCSPPRPTASSGSSATGRVVRQQTVGPWSPTTPQSVATSVPDFDSPQSITPSVVSRTLFHHQSGSGARSSTVSPQSVTANISVRRRKRRLESDHAEQNLRLVMLKSRKTELEILKLEKELEVEHVDI